MKRIQLTIKLGNDTVRLSSVGGGNGTSEIEFGYFKNLDDKLITAVDKLLKRASMDISFTGCFLRFGEYSQNTTSSLIVQAISEGLKIRHI